MSRLRSGKERHMFRRTTNKETDRRPGQLACSEHKGDSHKMNLERQGIWSGLNPRSRTAKSDNRA